MKDQNQNNIMSENEFIKLKESLKPIFRGYKSVNANMEKKLRKLGFKIVRCKNHYIMSYFICGEKLLIEIDKTPSDCRSGIKTVKDITKVIRKSGHIK
jgi:hypothetical protein